MVTTSAVKGGEKADEKPLPLAHLALEWHTFRIKEREGEGHFLSAPSFFWFNLSNFATKIKKQNK